jgi:hypothetical protein
VLIRPLFRSIVAVSALAGALWKLWARAGNVTTSALTATIERKNGRINTDFPDVNGSLLHPDG